MPDQTQSSILPQAHFALPEEIFEDRRGDRFLFFDPQSFVWFQTDELGRKALNALAKRGTIEAAADVLAAEVGSPPPHAAAFLSKLADRLLDLGFLHRESYRRAAWSDGLLSRPFGLYLHMTSRCNLKCPYCYNQAHRKRLWKEPLPTLDQLVALVDEMAELGFRDLKLTGGECLLHPHTLEVARHARRRGIEVNLMTNGTLIDADNAPLIAEVVDRVSLSLDSPHPDEHDAVRGRNTHAKVLRAFRLLRQAGVESLHVNAVVTRVNKDSVEEFLIWAWDELKASNVTLASSVLGIEGAGEEYRLSEEEIKDVFAARRRFERSRRNGAWQVAPGQLRRTQCGAANGVVSVDSNGDLYPCQTMHRPELRCGNVFETSLLEVLETSAILRQVKHLTVEHLETCRICPMRYLCAGGCRMEVYSRSGRLDAHHADLCAAHFRRSIDKLWDAACVPVTQHDPANGSAATATA
jgi:radical SAM protein with 4Fe4S-binding SPASM domain